MHINTCFNCEKRRGKVEKISEQYASSSTESYGRNNERDLPGAWYSGQPKSELFSRDKSFSQTTSPGRQHFYSARTPRNTSHKVLDGTSIYCMSSSLSTHQRTHAIFPEDKTYQ